MIPRSCYTTSGSGKDSFNKATSDCIFLTCTEHDVFIVGVVQHHAEKNSEGGAHTERLHCNQQWCSSRLGVTSFSGHISRPTEHKIVTVRLTASQSYLGHLVRRLAEQEQKSSVCLCTAVNLVNASLNRQSAACHCLFTHQRPDLFLPIPVHTQHSIQLNNRHINTHSNQMRRTSIQLQPVIFSTMKNLF